MQTTPQGNTAIRRLCRNAALLVLAFALSLVEHLLPISLILPLPGVKLGLANVVITVVFFCGSPLDAAIISAVRIGLSALLFGSPVSLLFSALGDEIGVSLVKFRIWSSESKVEADSSTRNLVTT